MGEDLRAFFDRLAGTADEEPDIVRAALWVARIGRPRVDVAGAMARIDGLAEAARDALRDAVDDRERVLGLCTFLHEHEGFRGNDVDYYAPENSYLDRVLETREGLPIVLATIYIAVGRRLGLEIEGVNFPGHFVARVRLGEGEEVYVDPFAGAVVGERDLAQQLRRYQGTEATLGREHLAAAPTRAMVVRMLGNLKIVHLRAGDLARALEYCDWIVELMPRSPRELRDRALILEQLQAFEAAAKDYEKLMEFLADEGDRRRLRRRIRALRSHEPKTLH